MPDERNPSSAGLEVRLIDHGVQEMFDTAPRILNDEVNRGLGVGGGIFLRSFAKRLRGEAITVRRRSTAATIGRVSNPAITRAAGFRGEVLGKNQLQGKRLSIRTGNPVMVAHEFGATIRSLRPGKLFGLKTSRGAYGLAIHVRTAEQAAKAGLDWPGHPFVFYRQVVRIPRRLGFNRTWDVVLPQVLERLDKSNERAVRRLEKKFGVTETE